MFPGGEVYLTLGDSGLLHRSEAPSGFRFERSIEIANCSHEENSALGNEPPALWPRLSLHQIEIPVDGGATL
jgi:hypothetical protein